MDYSITPQNSEVVFQQGDVRLVFSEPSMAGARQLSNMGAALSAVLAVRPDSAGHHAALQSGLQLANLPGRLQSWPSCPGILLDVGHNPDAARAIAQTLQARDVSSVICVIGMLKDKNALEVAGILDSCVTAWYCAGLDGDRGRSGPDLSREVMKLGREKPILDFENVASAMEMAVENMDETTGILVFGSFSTVEQATDFLSGNC